MFFTIFILQLHKIHKVHTVRMNSAAYAILTCRKNGLKLKYYSSSNDSIFHLSHTVWFLYWGKKGYILMRDFIKYLEESHINQTAHWVDTQPKFSKRK